MSSAELYDRATDSFSELTGSGRSLTQARVLAVATALPSGQVLIAGCEESARCATAELFSPVTDTFTKLMGAGGSFAVARAGAVAATLPSGQVLIAGGRNDGREMQSAELFNATTDTFSELAGAGESPTEPRFRAVAATLPLGQVLIAGGFNGTGSLSSAELFNPATDTFTKLAAKLASGETLSASAIVGESMELGLSSSSSEAPRLSSATPSVCTVSEGGTRITGASVYKELKFTAAGTCTIVASTTATGEYEAAEARVSFAVPKLIPQAITFTSTPPSSPVAGVGSYTVSARSSSGLQERCVQEQAQAVRNGRVQGIRGESKTRNSRKEAAERRRSDE